MSVCLDLPGLESVEPALELVLKCTIFGEPIPQGSSTIRGRRDKNNPRAIIDPRISSDNPRLKKWRKEVKRSLCVSAIKYGIRQPIDCAVIVGYTFVLPRRADMPTTKDGNLEHITRPDLDKLIRAANDSIEAAELVTQDSRIWRMKDPEKRYARLGEPPCAILTLYRQARP